MLFKVNYINKESKEQTFTVSGETEEMCKVLSKKYIKASGGTTSIIRMKKISSIN